MNYYKIEIEKKAKKKLLKMDKKNQFLILDYLKNTLSKLENPHGVKERHYKANIRENGDIESEITEF